MNGPRTSEMTMLVTYLYEKTIGMWTIILYVMQSHVISVGTYWTLEATPELQNRGVGSSHIMCITFKCSAQGIHLTNVNLITKA